jgi:hypothetical protein
MRITLGCSGILDPLSRGENLGSSPDRINNLLVSGAPAQIALDGVLDFSIVGGRILFQ